MYDEQPSFLRKLARIAGGVVGFEDPNSSPQANLGARIGSLVGRTGNALAMAAGTPEQRQIAEEQNQLPLKLAQIRNEQEYRRGVLGINQQNANTKGVVAATGAKTEQDKYALGDSAMGLPEGTVRQMADAAHLRSPLYHQTHPMAQAVSASREGSMVIKVEYYSSSASFFFSALIQATIRSRMSLSLHSSRSFSSRSISALICAISRGESMAAVYDTERA